VRFCETPASEAIQVGSSLCSPSRFVVPLCAQAQSAATADAADTIGTTADRHRSGPVTDHTVGCNTSGTFATSTSEATQPRGSRHRLRLVLRQRALASAA